ncbi:hypothetical protein ACFLUV_06730, partial [Elusimicrobiota bacterium]
TYLHRLYDARFNATYQDVLDFKNFVNAKGNKVHDVPMFFSNLILNFHLSKQTNFNLTGRYIGEQLSPIITSPEYTVEDVFLVDCGIQVDDIVMNNFDFDIYIHNVLDTDYEQGGNPRRTYPQQGRSLLARLKYHF